MLAWINLWHFLVSCPHFHYCSGRLFILALETRLLQLFPEPSSFIPLLSCSKQLSGTLARSSASSCSLTLLSVPQPAQAPTVLTYNRCTYTEPWLKTHCKHPLPLAARLWMTKATICVILVKSDLYLLCHEVDAGENIAHTPTNFFQPCWLQV